MKRNILRCVVVCIVTALAVPSIDRLDHAFAQQPGGAGGGYGGFSAGEAIASFGEYVYVLRQATLYQFDAYDLKLVKKIDLERAGKARRAGRDGQAGEPGQGAPAVAAEMAGAVRRALAQ